MADERIGAVLDNRYRIVSRIAAGSMGIIYRGERIKLGRSVAIKILHTPLANQERFLKRFEVEARALSRLSHPNCVSIIDFGVADAPYLVMEFIHGRALKELIEERALPAPRALHIFRQILAALAHAHGHGIVHRDIKPGNIMLTEATGTGDFIRILDFGLAKLANVGMAEDETGSPKVVGTPFYMSPEQASGSKGDVRSDIYSAGIVLFEMLTGKKPFDSEEMLEVLNLHVEQTPPLLRSVARRRFSEELEAAVQKALAKKPGQRFQTALAFAGALDRTPEADLPLHRFHGSRATTEGTTGVVRLQVPPRRGRLALLLAMLVVAILAAGAWYFFMVRPRPVAPPAAVDDAGAPPGVVAAASDDAAAAVDAATDLEPLEPPEPNAQVPADSATTADDADAAPPDIATSEDSAEKLPASGLERVKALIKAKRYDDAISELRRMRRRSKSAYIDYLLGRLYFEKRWWTEGMKSYRSAIRKNRGYGRRYPLIRDVISALIDNKTAGAAERMILRDIGKAALPQLHQVAKGHRMANMRQKAEQLIKRLR
jgi:serine/threonine-protein kinase